MIKMIGVDHTIASLDVRCIFAYRKSDMPKMMRFVKDKVDAAGIVLLSTCNRMELWVSVDNGDIDLVGALCDEREVRRELYEEYFVHREGDEAIEHLMWMTGGLKSAIIAEDQILTQVKDAIDFARQERMSDSVLDVLFRTAVTAGKKIKTEVVFHRADTSAIDQALHFMEKNNFSVEGKKCLVIGNGEYGKLVSNTLVANGADVTVTIRQYHSGQVIIPKGCKTIQYGDKYTVFPETELVVSATTSPNYTLFYDKVKECNITHKMILIDLAVPRDIDPEINKLENFTLFDIDDFKTSMNPENAEAFKQAELIIAEKIEEFHCWYDYRDTIPLIGKIKERSVEDVNSRVEKTIRKLEPDEKAQKAILDRVDDATGKVIANIFYKLRDTLDEGTYRRCIRAVWENGDE